VDLFEKCERDGAYVTTGHAYVYVCIKGLRPVF
jgi:hypothetical protein